MSFTLTAYVENRREEIAWGYDVRADAMRAFRECSKTGRTHDTGSAIAWVRLDDDATNRRIGYTEF